MKSKKKNSKINQAGSENIIHIKLEYEESVQSKKDILSSELSIINALKAAKKYHLLRDEELKIKSKLYRKLSALGTEIRKLQKVLPKIKIPQIFNKKEDIAEKEIKKEKVEKIREIKPEHDDGLENDILEIQSKLNSLANTNNF